MGFANHMVTYKQLSAFINVAKSNTFAEAAEKVHLSQPALSTSIKTLESILGGKLFSRTTRKVQLSQEGAEFLPIALRLIQDWDNAVGDMQSLFAMQRGNLTVAAMPSFSISLLPEIVKAFHVNWRDIKISVIDIVMESVISSVQQGRAEIGFTFETDQLDGLTFQPIIKNKFIAVVHQDHQLSNYQEVDWTTLSRFEFVAMNRGSNMRNWIEQFVADNAITLSIVAEANQLATLGEFVKCDLGISVVPGICETQFSTGGLKCIPIIKANIEKNIGMIRQTRKALSMPAQAMWDQVIQQQN